VLLKCRAGEIVTGETLYCDRSHAFTNLQCISKGDFIIGGEDFLMGRRHFHGGGRGDFLMAL